MLNPFPELLTFTLLAPLLLRVIVGLIFLSSGWKTLFSERQKKQQCFEKMGFPRGDIWAVTVGLLEFVAGILLVIGLWTQVGALVLGVIIIGSIYFKKKDHSTIQESFAYHALLLVILISLLFSGAGFLAFDLPL